jgi:hypothetical protein
MKTHILLLSLSLLGTIAIAQNARQGQGGGRDTVERVLDTNRDGVISKAEISSAMQSLLTRDRDRDGQISRDELGGGPGRQGGGNQPGYRMPTQAFRTDVPAHDYNVIIGRPTRTEVTLSLLAHRALEAEIRYGIDPDSLEQIKACAILRSGETSDILLTGLSPDTRYHYRVAVRAPGAVAFVPGSPKTFQTARSPGGRFVFTVQADSHLDFGTVPELYANTLRNVVADGSDFHIALGDTFMVDKRTRYQDAAPQYLAQRYYFGLLGDATALFFVLGNHDGEFGYRPDMAEWSAALRKRHIPNPSPNGFYTGNTDRHPKLGLLEDYFAWQWGDAQFICLDPFWYTTQKRGGQWSKTLGEQQYRWLKHTLESSRAKYRFIFLHYLVGGLDNETRGAKQIAHLYEWGGKNPDGVSEWRRERPGWEMPIHDLCVKHGVDVVYHGHDHLYVKEELDGVIYQEVPQPGHQRFNNTKTAAEYGYDGTAYGSSGHIRVTVSPEEVRSEYVWSFLPGKAPSGHRNGEVAHSYRIRR